MAFDGWFVDAIEVKDDGYHTPIYTFNVYEPNGSTYVSDVTIETFVSGSELFDKIQDAAIKAVKTEMLGHGVVRL